MCFATNWIISIFSVTSQLRESLVLDYGSALMVGHPSLWQCGASYLEHCPTEGAARLEILLPRIPMETEAKANKIIELARDNKLHDVGE